MGQEVGGFFSGFSDSYSAEDYAYFVRITITIHFTILSPSIKSYPFLKAYPFLKPIHFYSLTIS